MTTEARIFFHCDDAGWYLSLQGAARHPIWSVSAVEFRFDIHVQENFDMKISLLFSTVQKFKSKYPCWKTA
jgi:hypothetical protein